MMPDPWLPVGHTLPDGRRVRQVVNGSDGWQIAMTSDGGCALLVEEPLITRWVEAGLLEQGQFSSFSFSGSLLFCFGSGSTHRLGSVTEGRSPSTKMEALAFANALRATRAIDRDSPLHDALYVEKISRLLPTYSLTSRLDDDVVLGRWLTGGVHVSARSSRRLQQILSWLAASDCDAIVVAAGLAVPITGGGAGDSPEAEQVAADGSGRPAGSAAGMFTLPGRPALESFFREHVIDIVQNRERYRALGIGFPSAVVLHGPPGCGKTFAIEKVVEFLGWPSFHIDASSVASPYIHETSRKVAEVFDRAMKQAPSVLVIDEMEAFLADREMGSGHHRVEEVAEFLRRIPEAVQNDVWIVAMTNRIDMIDPAILRRGRFDHVLHVDFASEAEVLSLLRVLLTDIPTGTDLQPSSYAGQLVGRPLSDVSFVVREAARLAAKGGKRQVDHDAVCAAMGGLLSTAQTPRLNRRIGFSEPS